MPIDKQTRNDKYAIHQKPKYMNRAQCKYDLDKCLFNRIHGCIGNIASEIITLWCSIEEFTSQALDSTAQVLIHKLLI